jgi:hypothetical protein
MADACAAETNEMQSRCPSEKENLVKKYSLIVALLAGIAGSSLSLRAQEAKVIVTIPFEFVVGTQTLPSGTYTVSRTSAVANSPLLLSNREHSVFLLPAAFDNVESDAAVSFDQVGEGHVLSQIKTPSGIYTIDNHREVEKLIKLAQSNDHTSTTGMAAAGSQ